MRGHAMLALTLAAGGCASEPADEPPLWRPPADGHSYLVTAEVTAEGSGADEIPKVFALQMYASPSQERLIWWGGGPVPFIPTVTRLGDNTLVMEQEEDWLHLPGGSPGGSPAVMLFDCKITVEARSDRLSGFLDGLASVFHSDVGEGRVPVHIEFIGTLDQEPPHLSGFDPRARWHPLSSIGIEVSEPLAPDVELALQGDDGVWLPLESFVARDAGFGFRGRGFLDFGARYQVVARTPIRDLAGNVSNEPLPVIETVPDPGFFDDAGFENQPRALYQDCGTGNRAITGDKSLWMVRPRCEASDGMCDNPSSPEFTARLEVPASATNVRFSWRAVGGGAPYDDSSVQVHARGIGWTLGLFGKDEGPSIDVGDGFFATPVRETVVALPAPDVHEVLVVIQSGRRWYDGSSGPQLIQIDDLRVE